MTEPARRRLPHRRFDLRLEGSCTADAARELVDRAMAEPGDRVELLAPRPGRSGEPQEQVFVKAEFRRPLQPLMKRVRRARAFDEGRGYCAFQDAGVPTPELLFYGEQPRWLPRAGAIVATVRLAGENAATLYKTGPDDGLVLGAARLLGTIHAAGLTHGDAVLRNYLPHEGRVYALDLPRWGLFTRSRAEKDLALLIGSARKLGMDADAALAVLDEYVRAWPTAVRQHRAGFQGHVLRQAAAYADYLVERDRTREERHARRRAKLAPKERRGGE